MTAVFHHLAPHATVVGIEHIEGLVEQSKKNLQADGVKLGAVTGGVEIVHGDGREGTSSLVIAPEGRRLILYSQGHHPTVGR